MKHFFISFPISTWPDPARPKKDIKTTEISRSYAITLNVQKNPSLFLEYVSDRAERKSRKCPLSELLANMKEPTRLTHVLYHFESPDVVNLRLDQLPDGVLLVPYPLVERGRVRHQVRPVLLQGVQS